MVPRLARAGADRGVWQHHLVKNQLYRVWKVTHGLTDSISAQQARGGTQPAGLVGRSLVWLAAAGLFTVFYILAARTWSRHTPQEWRTEAVPSVHETTVFLLLCSAACLTSAWGQTLTSIEAVEYEPNSDRWVVSNGSSMLVTADEGVTWSTF